MQCFGKLEWEFTERAKSADFLDLTIAIKPNGTIGTKLFEKKLNLYLYIPPHSAHPPGVTFGLIFGMIKRIFRLTTDTADQKSAVTDLFRRLQARGHQATDILPMFLAALSNVSKPPRLPTTGDPDAPPLFLHLRYNPFDVPSKVIQATFRTYLLHPKNEPWLPDLRNPYNARFRSHRLIIAYSRPSNLRNLLFPRKLKEAADQQVSTFLRHPPATGPP
jgi:hypothetical protein